MNSEFFTRSFVGSWKNPERTSYKLFKNLVRSLAKNLIRVRNDINQLELTAPISSVSVRSGQAGQAINGLYSLNAVVGTASQNSGANLGLILGLSIPLGCIGNFC